MRIGQADGMVWNIRLIRPRTTDCALRHVGDLEQGMRQTPQHNLASVTNASEESQCDTILTFYWRLDLAAI